MRRAAIACGLALLLAAQCGYGQPPQTALHADGRGDGRRAACDVAAAAVIFTGQVVGVRRHDARNGATGTVEIEFAVEDAVRGVSGAPTRCASGQGMWPTGDQPFRVGQTLPDAAPCARGGRVEFSGRRNGRGHPDPGSGAAPPANATDGRVVDLRWIETRMVRPIAYRVTELGPRFPSPHTRR